MDVTIQESKFSYPVTYQITAPDKSFVAVKKVFSLLAKILVKTEDSGDAEVLATISHTTPIGASFDFDIPGKPTYSFNTENLWKSVFRCEGDGESYLLYSHKGLRYSIFQNDLQVAAYSRNGFVIGSGNKYDVRMDSSADLLLIACMVLALSTYEDNDDPQTLNFDFGHLGPEGRPYDETWQPR